MNPIINMMSQAAQPAQQNPMAGMLGPIFAAMQGASNPLEAINQMAKSDPRMQSVMDTIKQNGGIQQAVYAEAQRRNINLDDVLNQARQIMQSFNMK